MNIRPGVSIGEWIRAALLVGPHTQRRLLRQGHFFKVGLEGCLVCGRPNEGCPMCGKPLSHDALLEAAEAALPMMPMGQPETRKLRTAIADARRPT